MTHLKHRRTPCCLTDWDGITPNFYDQIGGCRSQSNSNSNTNVTTHEVSRDLPGSNSATACLECYSCQLLNVKCSSLYIWHNEKFERFIFVMAVFILVLSVLIIYHNYCGSAEEHRGSCLVSLVPVIDKTMIVDGLRWILYTRIYILVGQNCHVALNLGKIHNKGIYSFHESGISVECLCKNTPESSLGKIIYSTFKLAER